MQSRGTINNYNQGCCDHRAVGSKRPGGVPTLPRVSGPAHQGQTYSGARGAQRSTLPTGTCTSESTSWSICLYRKGNYVSESHIIAFKFVLIHLVIYIGYFLISKLVCMVSRTSCSVWKAAYIYFNLCPFDTIVTW